MTPRRWLIAGVVIPLFGILALIARAEIRVRSGETFRIRIAGYDPRDLLHGHYLQYVYDFDWSGEHSCGPPSTMTAGRLPSVDPTCCICLSRGESGIEGEPPRARQVTCEEARVCDGWLLASEIEPPRRYFIPEDRASALEEAFRSHPAAVDLQVNRNGEAAVGELYVDGQPWRTGVGEASNQ